MYGRVAVNCKGGWQWFVWEGGSDVYGSTAAFGSFIPTVLHWQYLLSLQGEGGSDVYGSTAAFKAKFGSFTAPTVLHWQYLLQRHPEYADLP